MKLKIRFFTLLLFTLLFGLLSAKSALAANYTLSGTVKDNSASAIVGATVSVNDINNDSTTTGQDGSYSLSIPQGTYNVQVTPPSGSNFGPAIAANENIFANTVINFILTPQGLASLTGHIYDPFGKAIPSANVSLTSGQSTLVSTTTDASGYYSLQYAPGTYTIAIGKTNTDPSLSISANTSITIPYTLSTSAVLDLTFPEKKVIVHV